MFYTCRSIIWMGAGKSCALEILCAHRLKKIRGNIACRLFFQYCFVLYLYIYIALLSVHTNQKRFQCERPREKRSVLKERKEALGSPVNKVNRVEGRSWFQSEGPMIAKARV